MPEHLHLLITESASTPPSKIIQIFKQRLSRRMRARKHSPKNQLRLRFPQEQNPLRRFWQRRYYDFNVYSRAKLLEKLHYMHANPVREKLVSWPGSQGLYLQTLSSKGLALEQLVLLLSRRGSDRSRSLELAFSDLGQTGRRAARLETLRGTQAEPALQHRKAA